MEEGGRKRNDYGQAADYRVIPVFPGSLNPSSALVDTSGINTERDKKIGTTDERR